AHFRPLGGPGGLDEVLREVIGIPEQVRVDVDKHLRKSVLSFSPLPAGERGEGSGRRFEGEGRSVGVWAVQGDVKIASVGPRGDLVAVMRTAGMSAGTGDTDRP